MMPQLRVPMEGTVKVRGDSDALLSRVHLHQCISFVGNDAWCSMYRILLAHFFVWGWALRSMELDRIFFIGNEECCEEG